MYSTVDWNNGLKQNYVLSFQQNVSLAKFSPISHRALLENITNDAIA